MRLFALLVFCLVFALRAAEPPAITATPIPAPAHANALGASVTVDPEGTVWLTWLERTGPTTALRFATLAATAGAWSAAGTIASGANWFVDGPDFPALTAGANGRATALWQVRNPTDPHAAPAAPNPDGAGYRAWIAQTSDGGKTWSAGAPLTRESEIVEFASLTTLADGRVLAAWLDGREKKPGRQVRQLFARIIGTSEPDTAIDPSVCDCCHTSLTAFPDGSALLVYRGRTADDVRDIRAARFGGGRWAESHPVFHDGWKTASCPGNGPRIASDGGRVAAAWFTAADDQPRVVASLSPDAGERFLAPLRLSEGKTAGRVAAALLHDGAMIVTSVDADGALWLRRVTPDFVPTPAIRLTGAGPGRVQGFPRVALRRDFLGGTTPAQMVVAWVHGPEPSRLQTMLVTIPEGELVAEERNCDCATAQDELLGFSIRGMIVATRPAASTVRVNHVALPGIFAAGEREFAVNNTIPLSADAAGRPFVGRIRRQDGGWQLFSLRVLPKGP